MRHPSSATPAFDEYVDMIGTSNYDSTSLRLASGAENLRAIAEFGQASGVDTGLFDAALRTLETSAAAGGQSSAIASISTRRSGR